MSKFFTYEDRLNLQKKLKESMSIKSIAADLEKNPTTVSREILLKQMLNCNPRFHTRYLG